MAASTAATGMQACLVTSVSFATLNESLTLRHRRAGLSRLKPTRAANHYCCAGVCSPVRLGDRLAMKWTSLLLLSTFRLGPVSLKKRVVRSGTDPRAGGLVEPVPDRTV